MWCSIRAVLPPLQICLISPRPELVRRASRVVRGESDNGQSTRAGRAPAALLGGPRREQLIDEWTITSRTHPSAPPAASARVAPVGSSATTWLTDRHLPVGSPQRR